MKAGATGKKTQRDARMTAINFVADAVNRALDLREIADNALHGVLSVMKLDGGAVYVLDEPSKILKLFASRGMSEAFVRQAATIRRGKDATVDDALAGEIQVVEDFQLTPALFEFDAARAGFATGAFAPIRTQGVVVGLLVVGAYRQRVFELGDIELIEVITNQIGNAMVHAQLQADLRASEEQYRTMIENSSDAIFITNPDCRPRWGNSAFTRIFGYTVEEMRAMEPYARIHDEDVHAVAKAVASLVHGATVSNLEFRFCRKDDVWIYLQCNGSVFSRDGDRVEELHFVVREVTEAKQRQEELLRTNRQLTALVDVSGGSAQQLELPQLLKLILTRAADLLFADAAYLIRFDNRTEQSEVVAATAPFEGLIGPRGPATRGLSGLVRASRQGRIFSQEEVWQFGYSPILRQAQVQSALVVPLISRNELIGTLSLVRHETAAQGFTTEDLQLIAVFAGRAAVAIDNTELVKDLKHKNDLLELLVEEAHHRIKNNLQMVSGLLQLQAETSTASGNVSEQLLSATSRVQAIAKVHNLLSQDMPEKVDAEKLITALVRTVVDVTGTDEKGPQVELDLERLWLSSEQAVALALIVNELVSNALLHGKAPSGERLHLRISCRREGDHARLQISDNGGGFPTGFNWRQSPGQGMNIIIQLAQVNLRGALEVASRDRGVFAGVRFDLLQPEAA